MLKKDNQMSAISTQVSYEIPNTSFWCPYHPLRLVLEKLLWISSWWSSGPFIKNTNFSDQRVYSSDKKQASDFIQIKQFGFYIGDTHDTFEGSSEFCFQHLHRFGP